MAINQDYNWPSSSEVNITGIGSPTGNPAPADAVYVGGKNPEGNLTGVAVTDGGAIFVTPDPTSTTNINLTEVGGAAVSLGAKTAALSIPVVLASDEVVPISATALPLPAGAATSANQVLELADLAAIEANQTNGTQITQVSVLPSIPAGSNIIGNVRIDQTTPGTTNGVQVNNFPATQPVSGSVTVVQPTGTNLHTVVDSSALPTGAATSALQTTGNTSLASIVTNTAGLATSANQTNGTQKAQAATPNPGAIHVLALSVGTSPVRLTVTGSAPPPGRSVLVVGPDPATLSTVSFYIGDSGVTNSGTTRGIPITVGQSFIANSDAGDYYIVASVAGQTVEILEQY